MKARKVKSAKKYIYAKNGEGEIQKAVKNFKAFRAEKGYTSSDKFPGLNQKGTGKYDAAIDVVKKVNKIGKDLGPRTPFDYIEKEEDGGLGVKKGDIALDLIAVAPVARAGRAAKEVPAAKKVLGVVDDKVKNRSKAMAKSFREHMRQEGSKKVDHNDTAAHNRQQQAQRLSKPSKPEPPKRSTQKAAPVHPKQPKPNKHKSFLDHKRQAR